MKGILGRKVGMTSVFTKDGKLIPVTVVEVLPNKVMQVKTIEKDGYNAIQLGAIDKKANRANKAEIGSAKKANTTPKRFLKEIRDYEVIEYFVNWRILKYNERKKRLVKILEEKYKKNCDLVKFIELVCSGKLKIRNRSKADIKIDMDKLKLPIELVSTTNLSKLTIEEHIQETV